MKPEVSYLTHIASHEVHDFFCFKRVVRVSVTVHRETFLNGRWSMFYAEVMEFSYCCPKSTRCFSVPLEHILKDCHSSLVGRNKLELTRHQGCHSSPFRQDIILLRLHSLILALIHSPIYTHKYYMLMAWYMVSNSLKFNFEDFSCTTEAISVLH